MTHSIRWRRLALFVAAAWTPQLALARCVLPVPDGGGEQPSPANVEGDIVSIQRDIVRVRPRNASRYVSVRIPRNRRIYTAFGGDDGASSLRVGQMASVWFVGCKRHGQSVPETAYFQIFSADPNDRE